MDRLNLQKLRRRATIVAADYGRRDGWIVEHHGQSVARLECLGPVDMFWVEYRLLRLPGVAQADANPVTQPTAWERCEFVFRSVACGEVVSTALADGQTAREGAELGSTVRMRALHVSASPLRWWDSLVLWAARRLGR